MLKRVLKPGDVEGIVFYNSSSGEEIAQIRKCETRNENNKWLAFLVVSGNSESQERTVQGEGIIEAEAIEAAVLCFMRFLSKKYSGLITGIINGIEFNENNVVSSSPVVA